MARRLYGWRWPPTPPSNPIKVKPSTADSTGFFHFFFLDSICPVFFPFWRTHKDQVSWAFTVCLPCGREPVREYCITYTHTHTHTISGISMVSRHTHTHTPPLAPVNIFPLWSTHIQFTGGGGTYQRRRLQFNYDNRRPDKTFVWTVHVGFSRQPRKCEQFSWMIYQIKIRHTGNDF